MPERWKICVLLDYPNALFIALSLYRSLTQQTLAIRSQRDPKNELD